MFIRAIALSVTLLVLAGCDKAVSFQATDITGANFAQDFSLTDHLGKPRSLKDFRGKLVIVFFGFVNCPDVCPNTMIEMRGAMEELGKQAEQVQVIFITVDPERDSQELLAQYVPAFDKNFLGLRGDLDATKAVTNNFKVFFSKVPSATEGVYSVDHTAASYVFDRDGKVRLLIRNGVGAKSIAADLKLLLDS